jgi:hypothetical protein
VACARVTLEGPVAQYGRQWGYDAVLTVNQGRIDLELIAAGRTVSQSGKLEGNPTLVNWVMEALSAPGNG